MKTNNSNINHPNNASQGFSLVELTVAIVVIAAVAAIGFNALAKVKDGTRLAKLENDVKTLNSAVNVYVASGGSLAGLASPQEVIDKMKTKASTATAGTIVGMTGSFVDPRIRAVMAGDEDAGRERAVWNTAINRFELGSAGVGAKEFALDGVLVATVEEDRSTTVAYGTEDKWVWDYTDVVAMRNAPNTDVTTADVSPIDPTASGGVTVTTLPAPLFSIPSGSYPAGSFPMSLQLTIPFGYSGSGQIIFQIDGSTWNVYSGPLAIPAAASTTVVAYIASTDPDYYNDSAQVSQIYGAQFDEFSGSADGQFENAQGPQNMDIEYLEDDHRFEWGTEFTPGGFTDPNNMTFEGATFENVSPEQDFLIGTLTYYNGTTFLNTTADTVELTVTLDLTSAGIQEVLTFELSLETTPNHAWQTDDQNADFVRLNNAASQFSTELNGVTYYLILSFGEHTPNGFTTINEFHVHEGATASGNIYGRLSTTPQL